MTIKEYRKKTGLSQVKFAKEYGFNLRTLQDWEQGRCNPPEYVMKMLKEKIMSDTKYVLTDEMKHDRLNCGEDADCNECSCHIDTDDCIYNHIKTVSDIVREMDNNTLAIYLHSWQTENKTVKEVKDLLNSTYEEYKKSVISRICR